MLEKLGFPGVLSIYVFVTITKEARLSRVCALTMVYRDHWALSRWYVHHAAQLGVENLFIIAHGTDPEIARICPGASIITVPREDLSGFDRKRAEMLDGFHAGLARVYEWVIRLDADELLCFDPKLYESLPEALTTQDAPVITALGFDVVGRQVPAPGPVLAQMREISFSGHYSKAVAARRAISFRLHGVQVAPRRLAGFPMHMPRGLYLAHLKYANPEALADANLIREDVARGPGKGLPGGGWSEARTDAHRFLEGFDAKPFMPWEEAEAQAHATLSIKPSRLERYNVVKARALKLKTRTRLPKSFANQG